jgi:2',3'-cyclic-nucleotide 2'-phosphodiesterase (5'-nucleotidase family)
MIYDPTAPAGARVATVTIGGTALDPDRLYRVAVNDFILAGGDGYGALGGGKVLIAAANGTLMANDVMAFVEKTGVVTAGVEGRITTVSP